jgi:hypothetical protein
MLLQIFEKLVLISQPYGHQTKKIIYLFSNQMEVLEENNSNPTFCFFAFRCLPLVHVRVNPTGTFYSKLTFLAITMLYVFISSL